MKLIKVVAYRDESARSLYRRFKKQCEKENLLKEIRRYEFYLSPSDKAKRKALNKIKNVQKEKQEVFRREKI